MSVNAIGRLSLVDPFDFYVNHTIIRYLDSLSTLSFLRCSFVFVLFSTCIMCHFPYIAQIVDNFMLTDASRCGLTRTSLGVQRYHLTTYLTIAPLPIWHTLRSTAYSWVAFVFSCHPSTTTSLFIFHMSATPCSPFVYDILHYIQSLCVLLLCVVSLCVFHVAYCRDPYVCFSCCHLRSFAFHTVTVHSSVLRTALVRSSHSLLWLWVLSNTYCRSGFFYRRYCDDPCACVAYRHILYCHLACLFLFNATCFCVDKFLFWFILSYITLFRIWVSFVHSVALWLFSFCPILRSIASHVLWLRLTALLLEVTAVCLHIWHFAARTKRWSVLVPVLCGRSKQ